MGAFSALGTVVSLTLETSRAASAAREALDDGRPLAEVVRAFAQETETDLDDRAVEELIEGMEKFVEVAREVAVLAIRVAPRLEEWAEVGIARGREVLDWAEANLPEVREGLATVASGASRVADGAERLLGR